MIGNLPSWQVLMEVRDMLRHLLPFHHEEEEEEEREEDTLLQVLEPLQLNYEPHQTTTTTTTTTTTATIRTTGTNLDLLL